MAHNIERNGIEDEEVAPNISNTRESEEEDQPRVVAHHGVRWARGLTRSRPRHRVIQQDEEECDLDSDAEEQNEYEDEEEDEDSDDDGSGDGGRGNRRLVRTEPMLDSFDVEAMELPGAHKRLTMKYTFSLAFQTLGVVFGDVGTSPLYVFSGVFSRIPIQDDVHILGALSLILYTLALIPLFKYALIVLRANDNGEGGTFALYSLICRYAKVSLLPNQQPSDSQISSFKLKLPTPELERALTIKECLERHLILKILLLILVLIGASMLIVDGILTPAISVMSAMSGLQEHFSGFTEEPMDTTNSLWIQQSHVEVVRLFNEAAQMSPAEEGRDHDGVDLDIHKMINGYDAKNKPLPIALQFLDVRYKVNLSQNSSWKKMRGGDKASVLEKEILHGITGSVKPGELLAMMGPFGSGKMTLLNLLGGRNQNQMSGTITYNGLPFNKTLKRRLGFVTQDDVLYPHLIVRETLMYAALLLLPKELSKKEKIQRAEQVIADL